MSKLADLNTLVRLLKEFELPVSPILEYAINEKFEAYQCEDNNTEYKESSVEIEEKSSLEIPEEVQNVEGGSDDISESVDIELEEISNHKSNEDNIDNCENGDTPFVPIVLHRKDNPWTDYEDELMTLYFQQGYNNWSIAAKLGRSESEILERFRLIGIDNNDSKEHKSASQNTSPINVSDVDEDESTKAQPKIKDETKYCSLSIKEQALQFMLNKVAAGTAYSYRSTLDNVVRKFINEKIDTEADSIYSYTTQDDVAMVIDMLSSDNEFMEENAKRHNSLTAALKLYQMFIHERSTMIDNKKIRGRFSHSLFNH